MTKTLKFAETKNRWGIALQQSSLRDGTVCYEVARVSPANQYVTIHRVGNINAARMLANKVWLADRH